MKSQRSLKDAHIPATDPQRRIFTDGTFNARDAGGYALKGGAGWLRTGILYRSDALAHLSAKDIEEAQALGIALVIDLRDPYERDGAVDVDIPGCRNSPVMLWEGTLNNFPADNFPMLPELYRELLSKHRAMIVQALEEVAATAPYPTLIHCTAGKDRTGIIIALVQALAGVPFDAIVEDFVASQVHLSREFEERVEQLYDKVGIDRRKIGPEPTAAPGHYLRETLDELCATHGSIERYALSAGMSAHAINRLRDQITSDDRDSK